MTSSLYWLQGNGKAEAAVKIVKRVYQKNKDIHLALLDYRNTPQQRQEHSLPQRFISRRTKGILPMTPALLQPEVANPGTVKTEIGARRATGKQYYDRNVGGTPHDVTQPGQWVYAKPNPQHAKPNPQYKHHAWPDGIVEKVSSPRLYTVGTPHGKIRRNRAQIRLAAAPPPGAKTSMSQQAGDQTQHSDTCEDSEPLAQPLHTTSGPVPPLQKELQSSQKDSPDPRNQSPAPTSPQVQHQSTASRLCRPNQLQHRTSEEQGLSQSTERSIKSDADRSPPPPNEVRTRSGRVLKAPTHLDL